MPTWGHALRRRGPRGIHLRSAGRCLRHAVPRDAAPFAQAHLELGPQQTGRANRKTLLCSALLHLQGQHAPLPIAIHVRGRIPQRRHRL